MSKFRMDFVINSSSSSFLIEKRRLSREQIDGINNHILECTNSWDIPWTIEENHKYISGFVSMDGFDMCEYFEKLGISDSIVDWFDCEYSLETLMGFVE